MQKAAEQCLLSLTKVEELRQFSKKLTPNMFNQLKLFCEEQYECGHLHEHETVSQEVGWDCHPREYRVARDCVV